MIETTVDPAAVDPQQAAIRNAEGRALSDAVAELPLQYREVLVLRELEELSYKEIARIADIPIGTVMSRLARARGCCSVRRRCVRSADNPRGACDELP